MNLLVLKKYAYQKLTSNEQQLFEKFLASNIINEQHLLKACINDFYNEKYKENSKTETSSLIRDTVLDVAIFFNVSENTVMNCVYKFPDIQLKF